MDVRLRPGPLVLGYLRSQVAHPVRQAALASRAREAGLDRLDGPRRPVGDEEQRVAESAGAHLLEEGGDRLGILPGAGQQPPGLVAEGVLNVAHRQPPGQELHRQVLDRLARIGERQGSSRPAICGAEYSTRPSAVLNRPVPSEGTFVALSDDRDRGFPRLVSATGKGQNCLGSMNFGGVRVKRHLPFDYSTEPV